MATATTETFRYLKSHDFKRAFLMTLLILVCGIVLFLLDYSEFILGGAIGILLTSVSDLQGSARHRNFAMLLSILTNFCIFVIVNLVQGNQFLFIAFLSITIFCISYISVYGQRASLYSFSGLMAIVLSLVRVYTGWEIIEHALLIVVGGLIYMLFSFVYHLLTKKQQTNQTLGELAGLISDYLQLRVDNMRTSGLHTTKLLNIQVEIAAQQEIVRNLILGDRMGKGQSHSRSRQMLLLIELIDVMELAIAKPALFYKAQDAVNDNALLDVFISLSQKLQQRLHFIAKVLLDNEKYTSNNDIENELRAAENLITDYVKKEGILTARRGALALRNLLEYLKKQAINLNAIERIISNVDRQKTLSLVKNQSKKFLTREDYSFQILKENFSFQSPILKHSLRLTIAVILGYLIGAFSKVENPYWVILTIIVIMRPSYGLTRLRSIERIIGTLIGVLIAAIIVSITNNIVVYIGFAVISMVIGFSFTYRNYIVAAAAFTTNIVFVFSLMEPNHWEVIQYRFIDTAIGATISVIVGYTIFPNWEHRSLNDAIIESFEAHKTYLKQIIQLYFREQDDLLHYKLSRKQAFLATGNLNASFQRFTQDPKSKQKNYAQLYEIVSLNESLMTSISNLGTFIQSHKNEFIRDDFKTIIQYVIDELTVIQTILETSRLQDTQENLPDKVMQANETIKQKWIELTKIRDSEIKEGKLSIDSSMRKQFQEIRLIKEELSWLQTIIQNIYEAVNEII